MTKALTKLFKDFYMVLVLKINSIKLVFLTVSSDNLSRMSSRVILASSTLLLNTLITENRSFRTSLVQDSADLTSLYILHMSSTTADVEVLSDTWSNAF